jgi:aspartate aminotransferase
MSQSAAVRKEDNQALYTPRATVAGRGVSPTLGMNVTARKMRAEGRLHAHFGFGQAPFPVPEAVKKALAEDAGKNGYLPADNTAELQETVRRYLCAKAGLVEANYTVVAGPGSKILLYTLQLAIEGDLIMSVPSWVSYGPQAEMIGDEVIRVPVNIEKDYTLEADTLRQCIRDARKAGKNPTKIILNSPNNPGGLQMSDATMQAVAKVCQEEGIIIISDEIYALTSFDGNYRSIARYAPERTVVTTGLSKHMSMGGWRVGVSLVPKTLEGLHDIMKSFSSETWSAIPAPMERAIIVAFEGRPDVEAHIRDSASVHGIVAPWMQRGLVSANVIKCAPPTGAFYIYPDFDAARAGLSSKGVRNSADLSKWLLEQWGVATLPGICFGEEPERLTLRLSCTDYDGAAVLEAYRREKPADQAARDAFVRKYCPNTAKGIEQINKAIASL